jgi:hypothetical protein
LSLFLQGGRLIGSGAAVFSSGGGGSAPAQVTNVKLWTDTVPLSVYATFDMPASASQITHFDGILSDGTVGTTQPRFAVSNGDPCDAQTCRVDFTGATPSIGVTATITATSSGGTSAPSAASNSVTTTAFSDTWTDSHNCYYYACGGSIIGLSSQWHDGYFDNQTLPIRYVAPGTATLASTTIPTTNAPAYPSGIGMTNQLMAELTSQNTSGYGYLVNMFLQNGPAGQNGVFNINQYSRFGVYIYPFQAGVVSFGGIETVYFIEGRISGNADPVFTFANQNFATNTFSPGSSALIDRTSTSITGLTGNTANTVTSSQAGFLNALVGDYACVAIGDQIVPSASISDLSANVIGPVAGVMTVGVWNQIEILLSNVNIRNVNQGRWYKSSFNFVGPASTGTGKSVNWICRPAFII